MAETIEKSVEKLLNQLTIHNILLPENGKQELISTGFLTLENLSYTIPNTRSPTHFGVKVNKKWFSGDFTDTSKPELLRDGQIKYIDYNLLTVGGKIFIIHYLKLRECALQLENDVDEWFYKSTWGMIVDPTAENFYWAGNSKRFPLTKVRSINDFSASESNLDHNYKKLLVDFPAATNNTVQDGRRKFQPRNSDFVEIEIRNQEIGRESEKFILQWEVERLKSIGHPELAVKIEWTSDIIGDGVGYDILSYEETGEFRYIEVKATTQGIGTPFLITSNELDFSKTYSQNYYLYRVFNFENSPQFFMIQGDLEEHCHLIPKLFEARVQ